MFFVQDLVKQNLTDRAIDMKDQSEELLHNAKDADRELKGNFSLYCTRPNQHGPKKDPIPLVIFFCSHKDAANDLTNLKKRLDDAEKKKQALQKDLQNAQKQLNGIRTGSRVEQVCLVTQHQSQSSDFLSVFRRHYWND